MEIKKRIESTARSDPIKRTGQKQVLGGVTSRTYFLRM